MTQELIDIADQTNELLEVVVKGRDIVLGYACPKCKIFHGATIYACRWEDAVIASREAAKRCCDRKCEDCGIALNKEYRIACIPCQRAREAARELVAFDKAEKVPESKYDGWLSYRNEYYQDADALQDHCEQNDLEWPAWAWSCSQTELSLDVDSILESALENHYEDARDSIGQAEEDKLQALLDEWCANQKIVSWEEDQSRAVILGPRELEKEDDSEDAQATNE